MGFSSQNRERGFTLIELLISMAIGTLVMVTVTNVFISQKRAFHAQEQINEMQQNARAALDLMTRDIKMAGYDPKNIGVVGVTNTSSTVIRIIADLNADGAANAGDENEDITYTYDATDDLIQRTEVILDATPPATTTRTDNLAENITDLTILYKKADGTTATAAADIRQVQIDITAQTSVADPDAGFRTYQLISKITPPNL